MRVKVFAVYDSVARVFAQPFCFLEEGQACRAFANSAADQNTNIGMHPNDFTLFHIGFFDDNTGEVESIKPVSLGLAATFQTRRLDNDQIDAFDDSAGGTSDA